jgi:hypothetical protein
MAFEIGVTKYEKEIKAKDKRRAYISKFANSRNHNTYLRMLLKHVVAGEQAQVTAKKLKLAVDTMVLDTQTIEDRKK